VAENPLPNSHALSKPAKELFWEVQYSVKVGYWDVDENGLMSLDGMDSFPCYDVDGHIKTERIQYFLIDGEVRIKVLPDSVLAELERLYQL
jgi:hypothetical protein